MLEKATAEFTLTGWNEEKETLKIIKRGMKSADTGYGGHFSLFLTLSFTSAFGMLKSIRQTACIIHFHSSGLRVN